MTEKKSFPKKLIYKEEFYYFLLTVFFYVSDIVFVFRKTSGLLNSDSSAEMILAAHLNKVGGFLSKDWCYSSELRVLNTQIVYKLALRLFPNDWHLARTFSIGIFLLILIAAGWYLMWAAGLKKKGLLLSAILICPIGQWYAWNVIYNSFYVPHIAISLISVGLFLHILKTKKRLTAYILTAVSLILSFIAGLGGVRQVLVCYAPLFLTSVILFLLNTEKKEKWKMLLLSFGILACGGAGYLVNANVLSKIYTFKDYNDTLWQEFTLPVIWTALEQLIRQFGWVPYSKVFTLTGLTNFVCLAIVAGIIICFVLCIKRFKTLKEGEKILFSFGAASFIFLLIVFAETWVYNESYWLPALPFFLIPILIVLDGEFLKKRKILLLAVFASFLILCAKSSFSNYHIIGVNSDEPIRNVSEWLAEQDEYTNGIASFWHAPIVTELTDGKIEMWTVEKYEDMQPYAWLQEKDHLTFPEGKVFVLIPCATAYGDPYRSEVLKEKEIYNDGEYIVYGFDSYLDYYDVPVEE